ncbi:hypothetical protein P7C73_g6486, partial [Tremellales sp. Uapishka_1]
MQLEKKYEGEDEAAAHVSAVHGYDPEKANPDLADGNGLLVDGPAAGSAPGEGTVHRKLKQRHIAMIALGGAIGTGLFLGSGSALHSGGPVGTWLAYIAMSSMVYSMMVALGEMATLFPVSGGFTHYATRFVDPALGFALGFNYWYSYAITIPTEVVAASIVITYWDEHTNAAVYITVLSVAILFINFWGAKAYGEAEFWFSAIKIVTIVGLILLGVVLMCGGGPDHDPIGFRYWRNPGPFNQITINNNSDTPGTVSGSWGSFLAWFYILVQAAFSFIGTEIIATTVGEAENPRKTVPKAIKRVFYRLLVFYVFGIFIISVLVSSDDPNLLNGNANASRSPFVIAIVNAGIKGLPSVINAVILIAAWSAGNSDLYASSRTLYALALEGKAPRIFRKCTKSGLPIYCVGVTGLFVFLGYLNTGGPAAVSAFNWLYNLSAITGLITWWAILVAYLRFYYGLKKQGLTRDDHPYRAPLQPWLSWYGLVSFTIIIWLNGFNVFLKGNFNVSSFFAAYITLPIFALAWVGWKVWHKTKWIPLTEIDFVTGRRELDEMEAEDKKKFVSTKWYQKVMDALF